MKRVVVVGAGMGGLSAAAVLASAGLDVTVLEAHIYPGGCAGTFYHRGFWFDAGATLAAGFYPGGPMDSLALAIGALAWPVRPEELALTVHLPQRDPICRWTDSARWKAERGRLGAQAERFWDWQEETARIVWQLAGCLPAWPPSRPSDLPGLARLGVSVVMDPATRPRLASLATDAVTPVAWHIPMHEPQLRLFVDGQLLISAQTTSGRANALYGAAALDLPQRGVVQVEGGMGAIAHALAQAISRSGGHVLYRHQATHVRSEAGRPVAVETRAGVSVPVDVLILNLTPWNAASLLGETAPRTLRRLPDRPDRWGAFTVYAGIEGSIVPDGLALHHQIILDQPLGEGNSVFLSISPAWDAGRAPAGHRALTLSTHTRLDPWWELEKDGPAYAEREAAYADRLLAAAERVLPGLRDAATLVLPGTPVTFERFTRRTRGWVGGFPQTSLFRAFAPRLAPRIWLVGDSIFPGQSVAAVALGGMRVAQQILVEFGPGV